MRLLGYILLIVGLVWICQIWFFTSTSSRPVLEAADGRYPATQSYSGSQMQQAYRDVLLDYQRIEARLPFLVISATLMLIGGVLVDVAGRRRQI
jgi:hypothetical protein